MRTKVGSLALRLFKKPSIMVAHSNNPGAGEEETGSFLGSPASQPNFVGKVQASERLSLKNKQTPNVNSA